MNGRTLVRIECIVLALVGLIPGVLAAQVTGADSQAPQTNSGINVGGQNDQPSQALSQTGLLPVFAVDMNFNSSWVEGNDVPTKSAKYSHNGASDEFQGAWDALKPAGFNAIRFALDLRDSHSAARLANLCIWAKANSVTLIPVLENTATNNAAAAFPAAVVSRLRSGDGQQLAAYTQIAYFQVEKSMNIGSLHPKVNLADAQKALLGSVDAVRSSESQALQGTGVQATPIMVSTSFDYELVQQGAIAGVPLDSSVEQKAQSTLAEFVSPLAAATNVDAINVLWFPGSLSSGDEGHFASLLQALQSAAPNKQVVLTTGFSSAFRTADQANQFFTVTLTNLWDFRLSNGGPSSHFQGVIVQQAFQGAKADVAAPAGTSDPSQWNWTDKAQALAQMWSQGKGPEDLKWWLGKVESNTGLLAPNPGASSGNNYVALPGLQTLQQISSTFAQAAQNITPPAGGLPAPAPSDQTATATNPPASIAAVPSATTTVTDASLQANTSTLSAPGTQSAAPASPSAYQTMLSGLVQQVTLQITNAMVTRLTTPRSAGGSQSQYSTYAGQYTTPNAGSNPAMYPPGSTAGSPYTGAYPPPSQPGSTNTSVTQGSFPNATAAAVWIGPQDVTVDNANVAPGQTVHITAQIHNGSADQDVFGLTVQVIDPANASAPSQNMQSGISVPRSGVTPVQLSWVAAQPGGYSSQPSILVLDATGAQVATAPLPAITITSPAAGTSASISTSGNSSSSGNTQAGTGNSTVGSQTSSGQSGQAFPAGGGSSVAPQISYFGPANAGGAQSAFSVQVVNPSAAPMSAVQAQLYVDGKPGPVVQLGPMLPRQTRSIGFDPAVAGTAKQGVKVVVTSGGASSSASAAPASSGLTTSLNLNPPLSSPAAARVPVRSGAPLTAGSGLMKTQPAAAPGPAASPQPVASSPTPVRQIGAPPATGSQTPTPIQPVRTPLATQPATQPTAGLTSTPTVRAIQPSGSTAPSPATRTIPTLGAAGAGQNTSAQPSSTPASAPVTRAISPAANTAPGQNIRTIPPSGTAPGSQTMGGTQSSSTPMSAPATRTIQPIPSTAPAQNTRTIPPSGTALGSQTMGGTQPSSTPMSAPATRTIQPIPSTASAQNIRTIPPVAPAPANQTISGTQSSSTPAPAPVTRTVQPPWVQPAANQTARATQVPGTSLAVQTPGASQVSSAALPPQTAGKVAPPWVAPSTRPAPGGSAPGHFDLSVAPGDIRMVPGTQPGQIGFIATIRNLGTSTPSGTTVSFRLLSAGRQLAASQPIAFSIQGSGAYQATWTTMATPGQSLQLVVAVSAPGDANPANNQASLSFTAPAPVQVRH